MLPGVAGKAVVLCATFALTSTAAVGMIICTYIPWTLIARLYVETLTSIGSLAGCPVFHPAHVASSEKRE